MYNELNEQLELGFDRNTIRNVAPRRRRKVARAEWWFAQIRRMIDEGNDPRSGRPVQGRLDFPPSRTLTASAIT